MEDGMISKVTYSLSIIVNVRLCAARTKHVLSQGVVSGLDPMALRFQV